MLLPAALLLVALASTIFGAAETPLSNEGVRRGESWRAYQAHLKHPQDAERLGEPFDGLRGRHGLLPARGREAGERHQYRRDKVEFALHVF